MCQGKLYNDGEQAALAQEAGAVALVILSSNPSNPFTPQGIESSCTIPVIGVCRRDAHIIRSARELTLELVALNLADALREVLRKLPPNAMMLEGETGDGWSKTASPLQVLIGNPTLTPGKMPSL